MKTLITASTDQPEPTFSPAPTFFEFAQTISRASRDSILAAQAAREAAATSRHSFKAEFALPAPPAVAQDRFIENPAYAAALAKTCPTCGENRSLTAALGTRYFECRDCYHAEKAPALFVFNPAFIQPRKAGN